MAWKKLSEKFLLLCNYYIPRVGIVLITLELIKEVFMHTGTKLLLLRYNPSPSHFMALFSGKAIMKMTNNTKAIKIQIVCKIIIYMYMAPSSPCKFFNWCFPAFLSGNLSAPCPYFLQNSHLKGKETALANGELGFYPVLLKQILGVGSKFGNFDVLSCFQVVSSKNGLFFISWFKVMILDKKLLFESLKDCIRTENKFTHPTGVLLFMGNDLV